MAMSSTPFDVFAADHVFRFDSQDELERKDDEERTNDPEAWCERQRIEHEVSLRFPRLRCPGLRHLHICTCMSFLVDHPAHLGAQAAQGRAWRPQERCCSKSDEVYRKPGRRWTRAKEEEEGRRRSVLSGLQHQDC